MSCKYAWLLQMAMRLPPDDALRAEVERVIIEAVCGPADDWAAANDWEQPRAKRLPTRGSE